jgi:ketosteroid isomerase-like protein
MPRHVPLLMLLLAATSRLQAQAMDAEMAQQVVAAESSFAATMASRDLDAFARFVAPEAVFFGGAGPIRGREAVVQSWSRFFAQPAPPFSWKPATVVVLDSGTLALSSGPVFDPDGQQTATFNSIWRREPNGEWKVVFDKGCRACDCAKPQ